MKRSSKKPPSQVILFFSFTFTVVKRGCLGIFVETQHNTTIKLRDRIILLSSVLRLQYERVSFCASLPFFYTVAKLDMLRTKILYFLEEKKNPFFFSLFLHVPASLEVSARYQKKNHFIFFNVPTLGKYHLISLKMQSSGTTPPRALHFKS